MKSQKVRPDEERRLSEIAIRDALIASLRANIGEGSRSALIQEFGVRHGSGRVDILVIGDALNGFEIKSDYDSLRRLPRQVRIFSSALDRVTLVVGASLAQRAGRAVPDWWGVWIARPLGEGITLEQHRPASFNPALEILATVKLLWKCEALDVLSDFGEARTLRWRPRLQVYEHLVKTIRDDQEIRRQVRRRLLSRISNLTRNESQMMVDTCPEPGLRVPCIHSG